MSEEAARSVMSWTLLLISRVGVDRVDYTKGILERFAPSSFFRALPFLPTPLTFIQIGAPSRTNIERYQNLLDEVAVSRAYQRAVPGRRWKPIVFLKRHHFP